MDLVLTPCLVRLGDLSDPSLLRPQSAPREGFCFFISGGARGREENFPHSKEMDRNPPVAVCLRPLFQCDFRFGAASRFPVQRQGAAAASAQGSSSSLSLTALAVVATQLFFRRTGCLERKYLRRLPVLASGGASYSGSKTMFYGF